MGDWQALSSPTMDYVTLAETTITLPLLPWWEPRCSSTYGEGGNLSPMGQSGDRENICILISEWESLLWVVGSTGSTWTITDQLDILPGNSQHQPPWHHNNQIIQRICLFSQEWTFSCTWALKSTQSFVLTNCWKKTEKRMLRISRVQRVACANPGQRAQCHSTWRTYEGIIKLIHEIYLYFSWPGKVI